MASTHPALHHAEALHMPFLTPGTHSPRSLPRPKSGTLRSPGKCASQAGVVSPSWHARGACPVGSICVCPPPPGCGPGTSLQHPRPTAVWPCTQEAGLGRSRGAFQRMQRAPWNWSAQGLHPHAHCRMSYLFLTCNKNSVLNLTNPHLNKTDSMTLK